MMRIRQTREIHLDELRDYVAEQVRAVALEIIRNSGKVWEIRNEKGLVMYVGLVRGTLLGDCTVWCMAGEQLHAKQGRWLLRLFRRVLKRFGRLSIGVRTGVKADERFAQFLGFQRVTEMGPFTYYEVKSWQP